MSSTIAENLRDTCASVARFLCTQFDWAWFNVSTNTV